MYQEANVQIHTSKPNHNPESQILFGDECMEYSFLLHLEVPRGGTATSQHFVGEGVTRKKYL